MATLGLTKLGRAALDLLYPPRCVVCGGNGAFLCEACRMALPRAEGRRCDGCWSPLAASALTLPSPLRLAQDGAGGRGFFRDECHACAEHPLALTRTRAAFRYEGDVRRVVHAFKFGGQSALAPSLGEVLIGVWEEHEFDVDATVPVPLTAMRRRTRGFNQALRRRRGGPPQAGSASAVERRRNVEGAFEAAGAPVAGKRLLLIDDVITTGATLDACARALLDAGASEVSALTLARED